MAILTWRNLGQMAANALWTMAMATPSAAALEATESAINAAYLNKFGFFIEWPVSAFAASDSPLNLCILGEDPFGPVLDDAVKGKKVGSRAVAIHRTAALSRDVRCHIVYLSEGASKSPQTIAALRESDVLTVTDSSDGGRSLGIINFVLKDKRVRFDIDDAAAASVGLAISSRLLGLALEVKPRR